MKKFICLVIFLTISLFVVAQTPTPATTTTFPDTVLVLGGAYNANTSPRANGFVSVATQIDSDKHIYSFTTTDIVPVRVGKQVLLLTSIRTGFAGLVFHKDKFNTLFVGDGGAAATNNNLGYSTAAALLFTYQLKSRLHFMLEPMLEHTNVVQGQVGKLKAGIIIDITK